MKKVTVVLTIAAFAILLMGLMGATSIDRPTYTRDEFSDYCAGKIGDVEEILSLERPEESVGSSLIDSAKTDGSVQSETLGEYSQFQWEINRNTTCSDTNPPDGSIYYGGEPPYGYIPTYTPKESWLPIVPLEPDG